MDHKMDHLAIALNTTGGGKHPGRQACDIQDDWSYQF